MKKKIKIKIKINGKSKLINENTKLSKLIKILFVIKYLYIMKKINKIKIRVNGKVKSISNKFSNLVFSLTFFNLPFTLIFIFFIVYKC